MSNTLMDINPDLGNLLALVIAAALAVLDLFSPIVVQYAFSRAGEVADDESITRGVN